VSGPPKLSEAIERGRLIEVASDIQVYCAEDNFADGWLEPDAILMIHGIAEHGGIWRGWVPYLARHHRVLRPDLRGFGRSSPLRSNGNFSITDWADDLETLLNALQCTRVHLVATKLGAQVAFELAQRQLPNLASMTLAGMLPSPSAALGSSLGELLSRIEHHGRRKLGAHHDARSHGQRIVRRGDGVVDGSDGSGRIVRPGWPVLIGFTVVRILSAYPAMSWLVADPTFGRILIVLLWLATMYAGYNGALYIALAEVMPVEVRAAGFSLAFATATAVFGGFTPAVVTWLVKTLDNRAAPGLWMSGGAVCGLIGRLIFVYLGSATRRDALKIAPAEATLT